MAQAFSGAILLDVVICSARLSKMGFFFVRKPYSKATWDDIDELEEKLRKSLRPNRPYKPLKGFPTFKRFPRRSVDLRRRVLTDATVRKVDRAPMKERWELLMDFLQAKFRRLRLDRRNLKRPHP